MNSKLSGEHIRVVEFMIRRDIGESIQRASCVPPLIAFLITDASLVRGIEAEEIKKTVVLAMVQTFKRSGITGIPVYNSSVGSEHWTLSVLRKVLNQVQVRYYDSLQV